MAPQPEHIMQFFASEHLSRPELKAVSGRFRDLAVELVVSVPSNPERTVALRKLLEAKDAAVRALIATEPSAPAPSPVDPIRTVTP